MSKKVLIFIVLIVIAVVAISAWNKDEEIPTISEQPVLVNLLSQNNSGESGTAALIEENGKVKVVLNLVGGPAEPQPAHIHSGSCAVLGGVKYPLSNVIDGQSETPIDATKESLKMGLPLAINVHKSETEANVYVACGDISEDSLMNVEEMVVE